MRGRDGLRSLAERVPAPHGMVVAALELMRFFFLALSAVAVYAQGWHDADVPASVQQQLASVRQQRESLRRAGWQVMPETPLAPLPAGVAAEMEPPSPMPPADADCRPLTPWATRELANSAGEREGVDPKLILAVMKQESGFNPCAVSRKGAVGLMQLMPTTADELLVSNPFNPEQNVFGGAHLLRQLLDHYLNNTSLALSAYNAGPARVTNSIPEIAETKAYVQSITAQIPELAVGSDPSE
jgi:soluble lytic murein transglycosylase-like protein